MHQEAFKTLIEILPHQLEKYPKKDALAAKEHPDKETFEEQWVTYSVQEVMRISNLVSLGLLELGIQRGDKVAIASPSRPEWIFVDQAIMQIGAISVPVYPTISAKEYDYIFNEAKVKFCFVSGRELYDKVAAIKDQVPTLQYVYSFDELPDVPHWKRFLQEGKEEDFHKLEEYRKQVVPSDVATIIYTSGTTGNPKGVMLTHDNIVSNVLACQPLLPVDHRHRGLSFLPLNHIFERMINYLYLASGISIYYAESMDTIGDNIREVKPHIFSVVPRLLEKVYEKIISKGHDLTGIKKQLFFWAVSVGEEYELFGKSWWYHQKLKLANKLIFSKWREALGGNVRALVSGSAALSPHLARIFTAGGIMIQEGYGLTESSPVIAVNHMEPENRRFGTVGPAIDGVEIKIAEDGEILSRGRNNMKGYFNNEEETKKTIDEDGWLHTGDIGEIVEGKFLKITDRKDSLFKTSGGKYVAPLPIEEKFKESFFIEQIIVVGKGRKFVSALIVPDFEYLKGWCADKGIAFTTKTEIMKHPRVLKKYEEVVHEANQEFGHIQQVKKYKFILEPWTIETGELTPTMKVKRRVVLEKFAGDIEEIYNE